MLHFELMKVPDCLSWLYGWDWCLSKRRSWERIRWVIMVRLSKAWMPPIVRSISGFQQARWAWLHNYVCKVALRGQQVVHTRAIIYCGQHRIHYPMTCAIACARDNPHYLAPSCTTSMCIIISYHFVFKHSPHVEAHYQSRENMKRPSNCHLFQHL